MAAGGSRSTFSRPTESVDWVGLTRARLISEADRQLFTSFDGALEDAKLELFRNDGDNNALGFLRVLSQITTPAVIKHILALIDDLLTLEPSLVQHFTATHRRFPEMPLTPFFVHMGETDIFISYTSAKLLSKFMVAADWAVEPTSISRVVKWFRDTLQQMAMPLDQLLAALSGLQEFLRADQHRLSFAEQDGLDSLSNVIRSHLPDHQVLYQAIYSVWLLAYNPKIAGEDFPRSALVEDLVTVLRTVGTDKVIRVSVAAIRNLLDKGNNNETLLLLGFAKILDGLLSRKWGDDETALDLSIIEKSLQKNIARLSSFDAYQAELQSGDLIWSPCHKSDRFWRENVGRFEENKCRVLGLLVAIIKAPTTAPLSLAVAVHDIGEFARFHPRGRAIIKHFPELTATLMGLLDHEDASIASQALLCCQKIMVQNWEFLPTT